MANEYLCWDGDDGRPDSPNLVVGRSDRDAAEWFAVELFEDLPAGDEGPVCVAVEPADSSRPVTVYAVQRVVSYESRLNDALTASLRAATRAAAEAE